MEGGLKSACEAVVDGDGAKESVDEREVGGAGCGLEGARVGRRAECVGGEDGLEEWGEGTSGEEKREEVFGRREVGGYLEDELVGEREERGGRS